MHKKLMIVGLMIISLGAINLFGAERLDPSALQKRQGPLASFGTLPSAAAPSAGALSLAVRRIVIDGRFFHPVGEVFRVALARLSPAERDIVLKIGELGTGRDDFISLDFFIYNYHEEDRMGIVQKVMDENGVSLENQALYLRTWGIPFDWKD